MSRRVAVCILLANEEGLLGEPSFLVVSSRRHEGRFVLPKGGIEAGESSEEAAAREAWEEAGLLPNTALHLGHLLDLNDSSPSKESPTKDNSQPGFIPSSTYSFELFVLSACSTADSLAPDWPEASERSRKWVKGWDQIEELICWGKRSNVMRQAIREARARCCS